MVGELMETYEKNARVGLWKPFLMRILLFILALLPIIAQGQITIDKAGDGWDLKIDSAITLIKQTDTNYYKLLINHCDHIEIWNERFSSNEPYKNKRGVILVSVADIKLNSINNLAAILVHESMHLKFRTFGYEVNPTDEELFCYKYELAFLKKLPNLEPWLIKHTLNLSK
jgi:hypothetical protein